MEGVRSCLNPECNEYFSRSKEKMKKQKYCSLDCFYRHAELDDSIKQGRQRVERKDYTCDNYPCPNILSLKITELSKKGKRFCCQDCVNQYMSKTRTKNYNTVTVPCQNCGDNVDIYMDKETQKRKSYFCDNDCWEEYRNSGGTRPLVRGEQTKIYCNNCFEPTTYIVQKNRDKKKKCCCRACTDELKRKCKIIEFPELVEV